MNLENLNLVELNAQEKKSTEGGFLPLLIVAALCLTGCAATRGPSQNFQGNGPRPPKN